MWKAHQWTHNYPWINANGLEWIRELRELHELYELIRELREWFHESPRNEDNSDRRLGVNCKIQFDEY
jgi:hypothetical protein